MKTTLSAIILVWSLTVPALAESARGLSARNADATAFLGWQRGESWRCHEYNLYYWRALATGRNWQAASREISLLALEGTRRLHLYVTGCRESTYRGKITGLPERGAWLAKMKAVLATEPYDEAVLRKLIGRLEKPRRSSSHRLLYYVVEVSAECAPEGGDEANFAHFIVADPVGHRLVNYGIMTDVDL
mgnify:CR=1 FL=1